MEIGYGPRETCEGHSKVRLRQLSGTVERAGMHEILIYPPGVHRKQAALALAT